VPGPGRAVRDAECRYWCLFAVAVDIVVIISRTQRTIGASCPATMPSPCSGIDIHCVRCSLAVVFHLWIPESQGAVDYSSDFLEKELK